MQPKARPSIRLLFYSPSAIINGLKNAVPFFQISAKRPLSFLPKDQIDSGFSALSVASNIAIFAYVTITQINTAHIIN